MIKRLAASAVLALALAGCGSAAASHPPASSQSPAQPAPSVTATCTPGYIDQESDQFASTANDGAGLADSVGAYQATLTNSTSATVVINRIDLTFYNSTGQETGSGGVNVNEIITPGQSFTETIYGGGVLSGSLTASGPEASCQVPLWYTAP
jgi:hypothetical protein